MMLGDHKILASKLRHTENQLGEFAKSNYYKNSVSHIQNKNWELKKNRYKRSRALLDRNLHLISKSYVERSHDPCFDTAALEISARYICKNNYYKNSHTNKRIGN